MNRFQKKFIGIEYIFEKYLTIIIKNLPNGFFCSVRKVPIQFRNAITKREIQNLNHKWIFARITSDSNLPVNQMRTEFRNDTWPLKPAESPQALLGLSELHSSNLTDRYQIIASCSFEWQTLTHYCLPLSAFGCCEREKERLISHQHCNSTIVWLPPVLRERWETTGRNNKLLLWVEAKWMSAEHFELTSLSCSLSWITAASSISLNTQI